jgi:glycosyltransferase involved in cell wall biosynthesis
MIPRKRGQDLVEAARRAAEAGLPLHALMIGEGSERAALERQAADAGLDNVTFTGFVNQSQIPEYLAASDAIAVTSSDDPHPLVVTEAASFGLPCLASDALGCVGPTDTARPGANTLVYPCGDAAALFEAAQRLATDPALHARMSAEAVAISKTQDAKVAAEKLADAVETLVRLGPR